MNAPIDPKEMLDRYEPKAAEVVKLDHQMGTVRFSLCGDWLVAGGLDGTVRRWERSGDAWEERPPLPGHSGWVQALAFLSEGRRLVSGDSWGRLIGWSYAEREPKPIWNIETAHDGWIRRVAASPDGTRIATCGSDRKVCIRSAGEGALLHEFAGHGEDVMCLAFAPDGRSVVSGDSKGVAKRWELATGKVIREYDARALCRLDRLQEVGGARALTFSPDGAQLACAGTTPKSGGNVQGTPTILVFDTEAGTLKQTLKLGNDGDGYVYDALWHRDGFLLYVTSGNPGAGRLAFQRPEDAQPFFMTSAMANCHALDLHPGRLQLAVLATNTGSNGNGRTLDQDKKYPGNWSPLHFWRLPAPKPPA